MKRCDICGNLEGNKRHTAHEMNLGTMEPFDYIECASCGCVQIESIPANLGEHYPSHYYSFKQFWTPPDAPLKAWLKHLRARYALHEEGLLGRYLDAAYTRPNFYEWMRTAGVDFNSRILDVGCGGGEILHQMAKDGFRKLTGIDPFNEKDMKMHPNCTIYKRDVMDQTGRFDFVMLNHVFEHMAEPQRMLLQLNSLLEMRHMLLLRIPVADCYAWREYGVNWYGLDAPRHLFIHTRKSLEHLVEKSGFVIEKVTWDSGGTQFWASEQNKRGISYFGAQSFLNTQKFDLFTEEQIAEYRRRAHELNAAGDGDNACYFLRKIEEKSLQKELDHERRIA